MGVESREVILRRSRLRHCGTYCLQYLL